MKIAKKLVVVLAIILTIPLIIALFTRKDYIVEREVVINKPKQDVFNYVKLLRNQVNYSTWSKLDPNTKMEYKGTDGTPGFVSSWNGNKDVGMGEQEIKSITEGSRIDYNLHFIKPMNEKATSYMTTDAVSVKQTKVKWGMAGKMAYPMNFMLVVCNMDKLLGPELQAGLNNLKGVLEK